MMNLFPQCYPQQIDGQWFVMEREYIAKPSGTYTVRDGIWTPNEIGWIAGIVYDTGDLTFHEAALLARAHSNGAATYLEACELEPALKQYWNGVSE